MRIKPTHKPGTVVLELGPNEEQIPSSSSKPVFRLKRVLVPLDFSACSEKALQYALPFASQFGAEIVLLHVTEPYIPAPEMAHAEADLLALQMRDSGELELKKVRRRIGDKATVKILLRVGRPAQEIVAAADETGADLILLSTHGRTGWGRVLLGSVAEHVTRHAHCPVLTVREREREFVETTADADKPAEARRR